MSDGNYIPVPRSMASQGSPIVINNACSSWHRLAENFTFANARAYIGTLFPVVDAEAQIMIEKLLVSYFGKPLSVGVWRAQNDIWNQSARRPYVLVGCHFQTLRTTASNALLDIFKSLRRSHLNWNRRLQAADPNDESLVRNIGSYIRYLKTEMDGIRKRWLEVEKK